MKDTLMFQNLPVDEQPRERCLSVGPTQLSNVELLAILLRTGIKDKTVLELAQQVLVESGGIKGLNQITSEQLIGIKGIGPNKATAILATVELSKRMTQAKTIKSTKIASPQDCVSFLMPQMRHLCQEHFKVIFLDTKNQVTGQKDIFIGSLNRAIVHPREVFCEAIKRSSAAIICVHNHPSGDPTPSEQDINLTQRLVEVGELVGIKLLDHLIIGEDCYISLKEKNYM